MTQHKFTNNLIYETSPYLLLHAHNPIHWYSWCNEALTLAKEQDKPIFLSIGYTACHWCHVMERESFENEAIANLLNHHFISIKVDREERPDLDEIYMTAVQLMTQSGGWPLSVWLTPDLKPFFGGTYFPPEDRWGKPGFEKVLQSIAEAWQTNRTRIIHSSQNLTDYLVKLNQVQESQKELNYHYWQAAVEAIEKSFDEHHGGFGSAPKFPHAMELSLLLRYYFHTGQKRSLDIVQKSLVQMAQGGIFDHVGGGFHRYATDERWRVPHFEKMLYDNALLTITYLEAFQITEKLFYAEIAKSTLDYVLREMTSPAGAFFSSQDADSEGEEGKFYTWEKDQIVQVLGEAARLFCDYYGVSEEGSWEGKNILYKRREHKPFAQEYHLTEQELTDQLKLARHTLYQVRDQRVKPQTDDKIITEWNGLMIRALIKGYQVLREQKYLQAAEMAMEFLLKFLTEGDQVRRAFRQGKPQLAGYLSDYASLTAALLDLYETTFGNFYLEKAFVIADSMLNKFWDSESNSFYFAEADHEKLPIRVRHPYDNAAPAGNSIAIQNLLRIYEFTANNEMKIKAEQAIKQYAEPAQKSPMGFACLLSSLDYFWGNPKQFILAGDKNSTPFLNGIHLIHTLFLPNKIIAFADPEIIDDGSRLARIIPLLNGKVAGEDLVKIFICENYTCKNPLTSLEQYREYYRSIMKNNHST